MAERYKCTLSEKALEKAVEELNEPRDDAERLKAIHTLRDAFKDAHPDLKLIREDDAYFLRYLRAKKFDQARALKAVVNYHQQMYGWPEVFEKVKNPALLKDMMDKGVVCPLEGKSKDGCPVIVMRPGFSGFRVITDIFALLNLSLDTLLEREETQVYGVVIINDLAYLDAEMAKQMNPILANKFATMIQESIPVRVKQVNFTNEPKIFDVIFAIVQQFLGDKMRKRLQLHGTDFSGLYECVDRSKLPFMFAGSGPDMEIEGWKSELLKEGTEL